MALTQQEALRQIADKVAQIDQLIRECENIAIEAGVDFNLSKVSVVEDGVRQDTDWNDSGAEDWESSGDWDDSGCSF